MGPAPGPGSNHNLPAELTSFVGRERELADLLSILRATRLLTLTGPGGVGKTRLAISLAGKALAHDGIGGCCFVDLVPVADQSLVAGTLAAVLGVREQPGRPILSTLAAAIGNQRALLLLDNCEHLVQACAQLADALLRSCPRLTILATSRETLRVPGETGWSVPPLGLPAPSLAATVEAVLASEAVQLFVERARAAVPGFALGPDNSLLVAQLCGRLDGLPLALELAAARLNVLGLDQIIARLDDRFGLLARGPRTAHARQQTLRATLDWSYELLGDSERTLFSRLGVFAGEWDLEAAEAVCAGNGLEPAQVLDLLTCLVEKSLVAVRSGEPRRYRLLETVRGYARQHLEASAEADRVRAKHATFCVHLAQRLGTAVSATGPQASAALEQLKWNGDNLRAALRWAVDTGAADVGLRLAGALAEVWYRLGSFDEGSSWLAQVLALPEPSAPTFERAWALNGAGWLAVCQGQYTRGRALNEESLAIGRTLHDPLLVSRGLVNLGVGALRQGAYDTARGLFEETLAIARRNGDPMGEGMALTNLSSLAIEIGDCTSGELHAGEALALGRTLHSAWFTGSALALLGLAAFEQGKIARARGLLEESLMTAQASGDRKHIARSLDSLGNAVLAQSDRQRASALLRESLRLRYDLGDWPRIATSLESLAWARAAGGQPEKAVRQLGAAAGLRQALQFPKTPRERAAVERWLPAARRHLGEVAFEAAWTAGQASALQQVIAEALAPDDIEPPATGSSRAGSRPASDPLTAREREVVALVARGLSNRQIAAELVFTEATAAKHVEHILNKLGFTSRVQIAAWEAAAGAPEEIRT